MKQCVRLPLFRGTHDGLDRLSGKNKARSALKQGRDQMCSTKCCTTSPANYLQRMNFGFAVCSAVTACRRVLGSGREKRSTGRASTTNVENMLVPSVAGRGCALCPVRGVVFGCSANRLGHRRLRPVVRAARVMNGFVWPSDCLRFGRAVIGTHEGHQSDVALPHSNSALLLYG
jgi:hypothetical protein